MDDTDLGGGGPKEQVRKWLDRSGARLEMQVAHQLWRAGALDVSQGRTYPADQSETGLRETDVVAHFRTRMPQRAVEVVLVIECKSDRRFPWAVLTQDRNAGGMLAPRDGAILDVLDVAGEGLGRLEGTHRVPLLHPVDVPQAYAITTAAAAGQAKERQDHAWNACRQASSAARALRDDLGPVSGELLRIMVPVVVTAAPLVQLYLDEQGDEQMSVIPRALLMSRLLPGDRVQAVYVLNDASLDQLASDAGKIRDGLSIRVA